MIYLSCKLLVNYLTNDISGNSKEFYPNFAQWLDYSSKSNGPMIYIGVPSHERAAYGNGFWRTPAEMAVIYQVKFLLKLLFD